MWCERQLLPRGSLALLSARGLSCCHLQKASNTHTHTHTHTHTLSHTQTHTHNVLSYSTKNETDLPKGRTAKGHIFLLNAKLELLSQAVQNDKQDCFTLTVTKSNGDIEQLVFSAFGAKHLEEWWKVSLSLYIYIYIYIYIYLSLSLYLSIHRSLSFFLRS